MSSETTAPISGVDRKSIVVIADELLTIRIIRALCRGAQLDIDCLASSDLGGVELAISVLASADQPRQIALLKMDQGEADASVARQLRLRGYSGPIIALTNDSDCQAYTEAGVDDFLRTPINPYAFISLIERHL